MICLTWMRCRRQQAAAGDTFAVNLTWPLGSLGCGGGSAIYGDRETEDEHAFNKSACLQKKKKNEENVMNLLLHCYRIRYQMVSEVIFIRNR